MKNWFALRIVQYPHPSLLRVAETVTVFDDDLRALAAGMRRLLLEHRGLGLAANQVGFPVRLFVAKGANGGVQTFVNPVITWRSGSMVTRPEGCLSWPGNTREMTRAAAVRMRHQTLEGVWTDEKPAAGMTARCWQHEIDHLDGINLANPRGSEALAGVPGAAAPAVAKGEHRD